MSKSLWSRSVWNSLFSRASTSKRLARKRRKVMQVSEKVTTPLELLEQRIVPAIGVAFNSATNALTLVGTGAAEAVTVKAGSAYTDILLDGKFQTRLTEANTNNISTISFAGGGVGVDSLNVIGVNGPGSTVAITLTNGVDRLLLNTKNTTVTADGPLALGKSTVAGALTINMAGSTAGDDLTQFGKVTVSGTTTVTTNAGDILLSSSGNSFGTLVLTAGAGAININESGPTTLGATAGASLTVKSTGAISDDGNVVIGAGATSLTSSKTITIDNAGSGFGGDVTLKGTNILVDDNVGGTNLAGVTASGTFTLLSSGAVSKSAASSISVKGLATIDANVGAANITLDTGTINFGSLSLSGATVSISEKSATDLDTTSVTNLTVVAKGNITDSGEITVTGDASFTASGKDIILDESTSTFGGAVGDTLSVSGRNISVINNTSTDLLNVLAKGTLNLVSNGDVTQDAAGDADVTGRATIDATGFDINFDGAAADNNFGSLSLFGVDVTIEEEGATALFDSEITNDFALTSGGAVTDTGTLAVTGTTTIAATGFAITLDSGDSAYIGDVLLDGTNVAITNTQATVLGAVTATGTLFVNSAGAVTQNGTALVTGRATVISPDDITLDDPANAFGSLSVDGDNVVVVEVDSTDLFAVSATGTFTLTSGGNVTDSGTVAVTGDTDLTATAADITLDSTTSTYAGLVAFEAVNVSFRDNDGLGLDLTDSDVTGNLTLVANGTITDGAAAASAFNVGTAGAGPTLVSLNAGSTGDISLTNVEFLADSIALTLTGANATIDPDDAVAVPTVALGASTLSGTLTLNDVNTVTQSGKLTIGGTVTITTDAPATDDIDLSTVSGNSFGTLVLTANDISIREAGATDFGTTTATGATGDLVVISSGAVTDSGVLTVGGTTSVTSNGDDITLDSANVLTGALSLGGDDITVNDTTATELTAVTASGSFTLTSGGAVTQTGAVSVTGAASVSANSGAAAITLTTAGNNFGSISTNGTVVQITEASATNLGATTASTSLTVISAGAITDTGTITAGDTTVTAGAAGLDSIVLNDPNSTFGDLDLTGGNITIVENAATEFGDVDAAGNLSVTSAGAITQDAGDLTIAGLATLVAFNGITNQNITLNTATNNFSSLSLTGAAVQVRDAGAIDLSTSTISGAFTLLAGGTITDSGVLTIGGLAEITASAGDIELDDEGSTYTSIDLAATAGNVTFVTYSGITIIDADAANDIIIIASGAITDGGVARSINVGGDLFIQAGLDPNDPTRELDPLDTADADLLNSLNLGATNPVFGGTETYVGSIVNVL